MHRRGRRRRSRKAVDSTRSEEPRKTGPRRMPNKLFVGNLGNVTKREVEEEFGRFGRLQDVWISRKPAGFAFVEFLNSKDASKCVQTLDGRNILGTRLRVEFAKTDTSVPPRRQAKHGERTSSLTRSGRRSPGRGLGDLMLRSSSTRLLPPPKPTKSMLAPVYDRTPSPLVLVRRGGGDLSYDNLVSYRTWDDSARLSRVSSSILLPSVRDRSRSPRPRSPLPLPPVVDRDLLSSSGRLLAPPLPALPSSFASTGYLRSPCYTPPHIRRYEGRDRSPIPVRYKSQSSLPMSSRSRSPARAPSGSQERMKTRSPSRSPIAPRPQGRLLGKTPPLPNRSHSSSPAGYDHGYAELKSQEAPAPISKCQRERSQSPLAYSSRKIARAYTPPSPPPKTRSSYEKKNSMSPVRKRNSPPPKAYALSSDRHQSPGWSRSRSKSVGEKYSSRSPPVRQTYNRSSSSTSPPRYGRSPIARESSPPVATKREAVSADIRQIKMLQTRRSPSVPRHSPVQRYNRSYTSSKRSASPQVAKRDRSTVYHRVNSPATRRRSPSLHSHSSHRRPSPVTQAGVRWSPAPKRSVDNRKHSPLESSSRLARNSRSPLGYGNSMTRSVRGHSSAGGARVESSPVLRTRRSPRRR